MGIKILIVHNEFAFGRATKCRRHKQNALQLKQAANRGWSLCIKTTFMVISGVCLEWLVASVPSSFTFGLLLFFGPSQLSVVSAL